MKTGGLTHPNNENWWPHTPNNEDWWPHTPINKEWWYNTSK